jgi:hypothetical protein
MTATLRVLLMNSPGTSAKEATLQQTPDMVKLRVKLDPAAGEMSPALVPAACVGVRSAAGQPAANQPSGTATRNTMLSTLKSIWRPSENLVDRRSGNPGATCTFAHWREASVHESVTNRSVKV